MIDNEKMFEKLKIEIVFFNFEQDVKNAENQHTSIRWRYIEMKRRIIFIISSFVVLISGVVFATNSEKIVNLFRGLGGGIDSAVENGYIEKVDMESITKETTVEENENLVENIEVSAKVDDFLMDDYNLSMKFCFNFGENIDEVIDLDNIHNIELSDLVILDENNVLIYNMCDNEKEFNSLCQKYNLNLKFCEFNDKYLNNGLNSFPANVSKGLRFAELQYNMYCDKYPKSKQLNLYFSKIKLVEETKECTSLVGDWNIKIDVPEKFYNRSEEYYKVVSCTNSKFNVYTAKVTDTCFEFGMTIDGEVEPAYPEELTNEKRRITEEYGVYAENGLYTQESMQIMSDKINELYLTSPYKEMNQEYEKSKNVVMCSGWNLAPSYGETCKEDTYVMNSNNQKFYCTLSPSRKSNNEFINGDRFDFYETFSMTKYEASDIITMVVNYRGTFEYIKLEKVK